MDRMQITLLYLYLLWSLSSSVDCCCRSRAIGHACASDMQAGNPSPRSRRTHRPHSAGNLTVLDRLLAAHGQKIYIVAADESASRTASSFNSPQISLRNSLSKLGLHADSWTSMSCFFVSTPPPPLSVANSLWFLLSVLCLAFLFPCQPRFRPSHGIRWWLTTTAPPRYVTPDLPLSTRTRRVPPKVAVRVRANRGAVPFPSSLPCSYIGSGYPLQRATTHADESNLYLLPGIDGTTQPSI